MGVQQGGVQGKDALARSLGWFSVALGAAQVAAPAGVARLVGLRSDNGAKAVMRAVGLRELATGVGILTRRRPAGWLWARVAGDAMDLALLAAAESKHRSRVAAAMAAVAGVTVPDLVESARLTRRGRGPVRVKKAITVNRPPDEVYAFWRELENLPRFMTHLESVHVTGERTSHWKAKGPAGRSVEWDAEVIEDRPGELLSWRSLPGADVESSGAVRFASAPGDRGTEIVVDLEYTPPGGRAGAAVAKLFGEEPATQLSDDLRRCKQVVETGEIARSDATPGGHAIGGHLRRPAPPRPERDGR